MKLRIANCELRIGRRCAAAEDSRFETANSKLETRNSKFSAFTLIEIMVAVMVFSLVIAAIYSTWALIMRASQVGQDAAAQAQRQRVVLRAIGDALMGVESFQASQQYYWFRLENGESP